MKWKPIYAASEREITPWEWVTSSEKELRWRGDQWPRLRVEELTLSLIQVFKYLMHWDKEGSPLNEIECLLENLLPRVWCNLTVAKQPGCYSSMAPQSPFITPLKCFSVVLDLLLITASFKEGKEKGDEKEKQKRGPTWYTQGLRLRRWIQSYRRADICSCIIFLCETDLLCWLYLWDNR